MPIRVRVLEARPSGFPQAGDAWPLQDGEPFSPSIAHRTSPAVRRPLVVKLPDETELNLGARAYHHPNGYHVTGQGETLGVAELIHGRKGWRGYLREGQLWGEKEVRVPSSNGALTQEIPFPPPPGAA